MTLVHDNNMSGHLGYERTYPLLKERFFWRGMSTDYRKHLAACHSCATVKMGATRTRPGLKQEIPKDC